MQRWLGLFPILLFSIHIFAAPPINGEEKRLPGILKPGVAATRPTLAALNPVDYGSNVAVYPFQLIPPPLPAGEIHVTAIIVEGSSVYSEQALRPTYAAFLNKVIHTDKLNEIAQAITNKYYADGYPLSYAYIPYQRFAHGVVKVQVVEAYVTKVEIVGNAGNLKKRLETYGRKLGEQRPLTLKKLKYYTLLMNRVPGVELQTFVSPVSNEEPGAVKVVFQIKLRRYFPYLFADNRGSLYLDTYRLFAGGGVNSWLQGGDTTVITGAVSPTNTHRFRYGALFHRFPLGIYGTILDVSGYTSIQQADLLVGTNDTVGISTSGQVILTHPLILDENKKLNVQAGFTALTSDTTNFNILLTKDKIQFLQLGGNFSYSSPKLGQSYLQFTVFQGVDLDANEFLNSSFLIPPGDVNFTRVDGIFTETHGLFFKNLSIFGSFEGEYAFNNLPYAQQYSFGSSPYGRAYDPGELTGDNAVAGLVELRYSKALTFKYLKNIQYYTYYDFGVLWNRILLTPEARASGTSAGVGARFYFFPHAFGYMEVDRAITKPVLAETLAGKNGKAPRFFFGLSYDIGATSTS